MPRICLTAFTKVFWQDILFPLICLSQHYLITPLNTFVPQFWYFISNHLCEPWTPQCPHVAFSFFLSLLRCYEQGLFIAGVNLVWAVHGDGWRGDVHTFLTRESGWGAAGSHIILRSSGRWLSSNQIHRKLCSEQDVKWKKTALQKNWGEYGSEVKLESTGKN